MEVDQDRDCANQFAEPSRALTPSSRAVSSLLILAVLAIGIFLVTFAPISDGDIYWHLAAGRLIVQSGALPHVDPFTASAAGRPWIDVHWLFQLGAFALYSLVGFTGLAAAKAAILAGGALLLTWAAERSGGPHAGRLCALAVLGGLLLDRHLVPLRPGLLTMLFLAAFLLGLEAIRREPRRARWPLVLLPLVELVWCNCQGLAPLGPALVATYLASAWLCGHGSRRSSFGPFGPFGPFAREDAAARRPLTILLLACLVACSATPYGFAAVALPIRLLARITPGRGNIFSSAIAENIPPFVLERTAPELVSHFKWVLLSLAGLFALLRPRLHLAHLLVFFAFLALALLANRNLPLFYWMAAPLVAIALAGSQPMGAKRRQVPWLRPGGGTLVVLLIGEAGLAGWLHTLEPGAGSPTPFHFPVESAHLLVERHVSGPVFAADHHGGYLSFYAPAVHPYLDTRLVLHSAEEYADYLSLFEAPDRFDALAAREGFQAVVLPTVNPDRYLGLIWHLARSSDWSLAYTDGYEVLFLREGPAVDLGRHATRHATVDGVDAILARLATRFGGDSRLAESARLHFARLLVLLGQSGQAERVLASLSSRVAAQLRARAHFAAGERAAAEALAGVLLAQDPGDVRMLCLLAESEASRGDAAQALVSLRRALTVAPYDAEARSLLARLENP